MQLNRRLLGFLLAILIVPLMSGALVDTAQAAAPTCTGIQLGAFTKSVAYIVAQREGFFAQEGLTVCYNQVASSTAQFDDFMAGKYDFITSASDNMVNRVVNSNLPISMVGAIDKGADQVLAINTANGIHSLADLRGKPIAVDAPDSGFVYTLRKMLAANGLYYEKGDYSFQIIGATLLRFNYLSAGHTPAGDPVYATILTFPFTARVQAPVEIAARLSDYYAPYQSGAIAIRHDYAAKNGATVTAFVRAFIKAGQFAHKDANRATVIADIANELGVSPAIAEADLNASLDKASGENHFAMMDKKGLINTIKLRREFGGFNVTLTDRQIEKLVKPTPNGLYDARFWRAAMVSLLFEHLDDD